MKWPYTRRKPSPLDKSWQRSSNSSNALERKIAAINETSLAASLTVVGLEPLGLSLCLRHEFPLLGLSVPSGTWTVIHLAGQVYPDLPRTPTRSSSSSLSCIRLGGGGRTWRSRRRVCSSGLCCIGRGR